jgi:hypothetical protein
MSPHFIRRPTHTRGLLWRCPTGSYPSLNCSVHYLPTLHNNPAEASSRNSCLASLINSGVQHMLLLTLPSVHVGSVQERHSSTNHGLQRNGRQMVHYLHGSAGAGVREKSSRTAPNQRVRRKSTRLTEMDEMFGMCPTPQPASS